MFKRAKNESGGGAGDRGADAGAAGGGVSGGGAQYLKPYADMIRRHGPCFEALLWTSRETQRARFCAIAEMCCLTGRVVVDAGCGQGDLLLFLRGEKIGFKRYIGVDALPELLGEAQRHGGADAGFVGADFVADPGVLERLGERAEIIVFSGSLNTLSQQAALRVLDSAWRACTEALVFNFLCEHRSGAIDPEEGPARRFDTMEMLRFALDRTARVTFRQDYLDGQDGTIAMRV